MECFSLQISGDVRLADRIEVLERNSNAEQQKE